MHVQMSLQGGDTIETFLWFGTANKTTALMPDISKSCIINFGHILHSALFGLLCLHENANRRFYSIRF